MSILSIQEVENMILVHLSSFSSPIYQISKFRVSKGVKIAIFEIQSLGLNLTLLKFLEHSVWLL